MTSGFDSLACTYPHDAVVKTVAAMVLIQLSQSIR